MGGEPQDLATQIQLRMREHAFYLTGKPDSDGFIIAGLIRTLSNLYENVRQSTSSEDDLSGPRMGLLIRLMEEERLGNQEGITPTVLSRNQHVSRNTISALLRGLEDQGMIERHLDPKDRRLFRIRITPHGRERVQAIAPQRIELANQLAEVLTPDEQTLLIELLNKLFASLHAQCSSSPANRDPDPSQGED
jgi:DNA-binding MarR family transcriptional regulator